MKVILRTDITNVGRQGEIKEVALLSFCLTECPFFCEELPCVGGWSGGVSFVVLSSYVWLIDVGKGYVLCPCVNMWL